MASYFSSNNSLNSFRSRKVAEDVDPMTSMSGIGDVMLVFAVGLMTALVVAWSVDLNQFAEDDVGAEIEDVEQMEEELEGTGSYVEAGKVYLDPATGRYYLVQENTESYADDSVDLHYDDASIDSGIPYYDEDYPNEEGTDNTEG